MFPERAIHLGVDPSEIQVMSWANRHGGKWTCFVQDGDRGRVLFQSASVFEATQWAGKVRRLAGLV